jgi:hypothetical protein
MLLPNTILLIVLINISSAMTVATSGGTDYSSVALKRNGGAEVSGALVLRSKRSCLAPVAVLIAKLEDTADLGYGRRILWNWRRSPPTTTTTALGLSHNVRRTSWRTNENAAVRKSNRPSKAVPCNDPIGGL